METKIKQYDFQTNSINDDERSVIIIASTNVFHLEKIQSSSSSIFTSPNKKLVLYILYNIINYPLKYQDLRHDSIGKMQIYNHVLQ